jgi:hypothetical protein
MPYVTSFSQPGIIKLKSRICGFIYTRRSDCDVFNILFRNGGVRSIVPLNCFVLPCTRCKTGGKKDIIDISYGETCRGEHGT